MARDIRQFNRIWVLYFFLRFQLLFFSLLSCKSFHIKGSFRSFLRLIFLKQFFFFVAFGLIHLIQFLLNLFNSLTIDSCQLFLLLHVLTILRAEVFFLKLDLIVRVPNVVSLHNSHTNVISNFLSIVINSVCFTCCWFCSPLCKALSYLDFVLNSSALQCLFKTLSQSIFNFGNLNLSVLDWFVHACFGVSHSVDPW